MTDSPWLTLIESATYEKRGRRWLAREAKAGRVKHARVGGRRELMFRREWLDEHIESMTMPVVMPARREIAASYQGAIAQWRDALSPRTRAASIADPGSTPVVSVP